MKGQSALEFITTYSWAILAITFVIAVLFFTGYFSMSKFYRTECVIHPDFPCSKPVAYYDGSTVHVKANITNGIQYNITINEIMISDTERNSGSVGALPVTIKPGDSFIMDAEFDVGKGWENTVKRFFVVINYTDEFGIDHTAAGRIVTKVEP
ncbi:hypothetical protein J7K41_00340 [Candidatus Micrarchaeota archaeon]|nr:hypothetical protein [Candidatus Micrarchaeota archaeon]